MDFAFRIDGLSLIFGLLISGIGTLVLLYAAFYMAKYERQAHFFTYLTLFMGAMIGLVFSDNLMVLFIFWEITSVTSFFLIGFDHHVDKSRQAALQALLITGFGGLCLLFAVILTGNITGTYVISELLQQSIHLGNHPQYYLILALIILGAITKSAQFPFHFWLPGAMEAPTPVSTYLHSATMVKAGIYLLARFTPILGDHTWWNSTLIIIGTVTMVYAAIHSIFRLDMKSILAYSTISALGILVFLIGLGTDQALLAAAVFILVHALYKATLFLITGIVDHETGTRDISKLGGLRKVLLPVAIAGVFAALSNAGIPPSFGFLGKDLIYEGTLHYGEWAYWLTGAAVVTNICLLFAGFLVGFKPFIGKLSTAYEEVHLPSALMWVPPLILASLGIIFGIFPSLIEGSIIKPVV